MRRMIEEERARVKKQIGIWKETAAELDRIKCEALRALTEEESARVAERLCQPLEGSWFRPGHPDGSGLVEQQRLFRKAHERKPRL